MKLLSAYESFVSRLFFYESFKCTSVVRSGVSDAGWGENTI